MTDIIPARLDALAPANARSMAVLRDIHDAAPEAVTRLRAIVKDGGDRTAVAAAKLLLGLAGYVAPSAPKDADPDRQLAELSPDELKAMVDRLEGELAARAKPVNAPKASVEPDKAADMLD